MASKHAFLSAVLNRARRREEALACLANSIICSRNVIGCILAENNAFEQEQTGGNRALTAPAQGGSVGSSADRCSTDPFESATFLRFESEFLLLREEPRMHIHVMSPEGEAKFRIEPVIELAVNKGLKTVELTELMQIVEARQDEIRDHWHRHFG
jgi:hypothetical protein